LVGAALRRHLAFAFSFAAGAAPFGLKGADFDFSCSCQDEQYRSAVNVLAMKHAQNFNAEFFSGQEHHAVVADAEPKFMSRWFQFFHVANSATEITVDSAQNAHRRPDRRSGGLRELPATRE
jgi:hypothetical protein